MGLSSTLDWGQHIYRNFLFAPPFPHQLSSPTYLPSETSKSKSQIINTRHSKTKFWFRIPEETLKLKNRVKSKMNGYFIYLKTKIFYIIPYVKYTTKIYCIVQGTMGFPRGSAGKESACNEGDLGPGKGKAYPLLYSGLENSMDQYSPGVTNSRTTK